MTPSIFGSAEYFLDLIESTQQSHSVTYAR